MTLKLSDLKNPMTRRGYQRLAEEHRHLLEDVRPGILDGIATAAAEGDRSENAEYIYGRKRLRELDKKLRQLTGFLKDAQVIDPENIRSDRIFFGATVTIRDEEDVVREWTIVGMGEADADARTISWKSPLGRALLDKKVGDLVTVERPAGSMDYKILKIQFK